MKDEASARELEARPEHAPETHRRSPHGVPAGPGPDQAAAAATEPVEATPAAMTARAARPARFPAVWPSPLPLPRPPISLPDGRRAGVHLPVGAGLLKVADRASAIGASTLQLFSDNPTAWQRRTMPLAHADEFRARVRASGLGPLAIHASYLINLAGPVEELFELSVGLLRHELSQAHEFGAAYVNVHIGSHRGSGVEAGIRRLVDGVAMATDGLDVGPDPQLREEPAAGPARPLLVLENSSGGGAGIGSRIEEMAAVLDEAGTRGLADCLAFCLDSAHLWGAGYDVGSAEGVDETLALFDRLIGLDRLAMIHLNDSHASRGSRHDRHANVGEGLIGRDGLARLLCHPALARASYYLETPDTEKGYDVVNVARLEDLAAGRPLTPGPKTATSQPR